MSEQVGDPWPWNYPNYWPPVTVYTNFPPVQNTWAKIDIPDNLKVKKLHEDAKLPSKSRDSDEGYDLYSLESFEISINETYKVRTGIALGLPKGYWGKIEGRSGLAAQGLTVFGGVIDEEYTGEIIVCLHNSNNWLTRIIRKGDKIAQLVLHKHRHFDILEVDNLDTTERGEAGFGSSGQ